MSGHWRYVERRGYLTLCLEGQGLARTYLRYDDIDDDGDGDDDGDDDCDDDDDDEDLLQEDGGDPGVGEARDGLR